MLLLLLILYRIYRVIRTPAALDGPDGVMRRVGVGAMKLGIICTAGLFVLPFAARWLFPRSDSVGIAAFFIGIVLYLGSNLSWVGVVIFEISRLSGRAGNPFKAMGRSAQVGGFAAVGVALLALGIVWFSLRSEHQKFVQLCPAIAKPQVLARTNEAFDSIVLDDKSLADLAPRYGIQPSNIVMVDQLSYVEHCDHLQSWRCEKTTNAREGQAHRNPSARIDKPESAIEFSSSPLTTRSTRMGATIYELEYRIRDRRSGKVFATASELVFDWGPLSGLSGLIAETSATGIDACGYAAPEPHYFRSNIAAFPIYDAYNKADRAFIASVFPIAEPRRAQ